MATIMVVATTICVNAIVITVMIATPNNIMTMAKTILATMTKNTTTVTSVTIIFKQV